MPKKSNSKIKYIESDSEDESVSDNESVVSEEEVVEEQDIQVTVKKVTKQKLSYSDVKESIIELRAKRDLLLEENDEFNKSILTNNKEIRRLCKEILKKDKILDKIHMKDLKLASKEKRKRTKPNMGGICEPREIPQTLRKYIGKEMLPDDIKLMKRHEVCKLFHAALKRDKQKKDRDILISKKSVAKALGVEKGTTIQFKDQPTFLASFYK